MNESAWVLKGVDPETRERAVEEAQRLGVSLADYLTDKVLHATILEQAVAAAPEHAQEPAEPGVRHRFRALERRIESSVSSLDGAIFEISERVDELEAFAGGAAQAFQQGLQDTAEQLTALRQHTEENAQARSSENAAAHESFAASIAALGHYVEDVDAIARRAETNAAVLADAHETLKHAVADDFSELSEQLAARLNAGLREVAAAADEAAAQADTAVANLVIELRGVRQSLEQSVADGVDETRRRVHAAFSETAERMAALTDRVDQIDRHNAVSADQIRSRMADLEDSAQAALEDTAESLRQAGAALAADLQRMAQDQRAALESVHSDLSSEIADLHDRQQGALARLKLLDAAVSHGVNDLAALRGQMLDRIDEAERAGADRAAQVLNVVAERADALASRLARHQEQTAETNFQLRAETERVEASTVAALEKLAGDIALGRSEAAQMVEQVRARAQAETAELREQQSGFGARLTIIDLALRSQTSLIERISQVEAALSEAASGAKLADMEAQVNVLRQAIGRSGDEELTQRINELGARLADAANGDAALDSKLADVEAQMNVLRQAIAKSGDDSLLRRIEELRGGGDALNARLADIEAQVNVLRQAVAKSGDDQVLRRMAELNARIDDWDRESKVGAEKAEDLVRLMGRLTANYAEASAQADERLHKLEIALADLRLEHIAVREAPAASVDEVVALESRVSAVERLHAAGMPGAIAPEDIAQLEQRLSAMEARQNQALEQLRADIVRFVGDNDRRLATLEAPEVDYNLAAEFDALRRRVEDRILGIEQRSVRTLEQVADTVAMLEERFTGRQEGARESA